MKRMNHPGNHVSSWRRRKPGWFKSSLVFLMLLLYFVIFPVFSFVFSSWGPCQHCTAVGFQHSRLLTWKVNTWAESGTKHNDISSMNVHDKIRNETSMNQTTHEARATVQHRTKSSHELSKRQDDVKTPQPEIQPNIRQEQRFADRRSERRLD